MTCSQSRSNFTRLPGMLLWAILIVGCGMPLAWLAGQIVGHPHVLADAVPDGFRWRLIGRTFAFNALAATLATLLALPVAAVLGLSRARWTRLLWIILPVPLLLPSLVLTYGWTQAHGLLGEIPMPQSPGDVARCVIALASWVWPVPALVVAIALRQVDANLLLSARLDGAAGRILVRLAAGPVVVGWLAAMLLALQEFAVFEPTGISVIATEVRAVFETGSSLEGGWTMPSDAGGGIGPSQAARTSAALAVMLPTLVAWIGLGIIGWRAARRLADGIDWQGNDPPVAMRVPWVLHLAAAAVVLLAIGLPMGAMVLSLRTTFDPTRIVREYTPQLVGSVVIAATAACVGAAIVVLGSAAGVSRRAIGLALASFLVGGQWTAIALIVIFNRPVLWNVYDTIAMPVIAYVGRFGWIGLCAAAFTWSPGVRWARDLAAADGAGRWTTWRHVVAPLAWPMLLGAALLIFALSLTEVPATTLLQPPMPTLVPMLMTWAHIQNYDAMIEASLLLAAIVAVFGVCAAMLVRWAVRKAR